MGAVAQSKSASSDPARMGIQDHPVLFVGPDHAVLREEIDSAVRRADAEAVFCWDVDEARAVLAREDLPVPRCVVVDNRLDGLEAFVPWIRGEARLFPVPVVVQVPVPSDRAYLEAQSIGADDVAVFGDVRGIIRRIANLADFDPAARPPLTQGRAVVAQASEVRRRVLGRILRQAGFDVSFALDTADLVRVAQALAEPPTLVVADAGLPGDGPIPAANAVRARDGFDSVAFVITAAAEDVRQYGEEADRLGKAAVSYEAAPPDNLLFLANELLRPEVQNVRASTRLLYGAICAFREAGTLEPTYGLTYNLSREGLYVRTLDPPAPGTKVWLEMRPPHADAAVHLRAKAVWARGLRSPGGAAPPGFGVRLLDEAGPAADRAAYESGYERLRTS
ncbi:MAG: PilZ domain-containing protein [Myxococcota bacterium]